MKSVRFILMLLASVSIFFLVSFINIKLLFSSVTTAKNLLNESNIYPVAAAGIRDNIVKYAQVPVDQNQLVEIVNSAITEKDLKVFVEDYVDQFYNIVNGKDKDEKITLHFSWLRDKVNAQINGNADLTQVMSTNNVLADKEIDLTSNPLVSMIIHANDFVIGFGIAAFVFLLLLLLSGSWAQKFVWLGATCIVSGVYFIGELIIYYFGITPRVLENLAKESKLEDQRFLLGVQKLITSIVNYQKVFYTSITVGLIIVGIILIIIGKSLKKHDVGMEKI